jgi:acyl transferase domain-containing protein
MTNPVLATEDRVQENFVEYRVGTRSNPYLADHGFQDMAVLPGSWYVETALRAYHALSGGDVAGVVRNVSFRNPILLSQEDTLVVAHAEAHGDGRVEYSFSEVDASSQGSTAPAAVSL